MKKRILGILLCLIMAVGMFPTMAMAQETAPAFDLETDLKDIPILENLVTCICETTGESKTYGQLPEGFTDMDDIEVVTVSFEADDLASTNLSLKNFQLVNVPEGFTVTVEESALRVYVLGKKSIISGIAAGCALGG